MLLGKKNWPAYFGKPLLRAVLYQLLEGGCVKTSYIQAVRTYGLLDFCPALHCLYVVQYTSYWLIFAAPGRWFAVQSCQLLTVEVIIDWARQGRLIMDDSIGRTCVNNNMGHNSGKFGQNPTIINNVIVVHNFRFRVNLLKPKTEFQYCNKASSLRY